MIFRLLFVFIVLILVACSIDFDRDYDQIDDDMVRPISYRFINPETAPGDIAEVEILFVGKPITLGDISRWRVSWDFYTDDYGNIAPRGEQDLKLIGAPTIREENNGQIVNIKFQIPDSILYKASVIPENLGDMIKDADIDISTLPFNKKSAVIDYILGIADLPLEEKQKISYIEGAMLNGLTQLFSARYEIYMDFNNGTPRTKFRNTARLHRKLDGIAGIYLNKNPEVAFGKWKVWAMNEKDAYNFDSTKAVKILPVGDTIIIPVDKNKSIFMEVWASPKDSTITMEAALTTQKASIEDYRMNSFFEGKKLFDGLSFGGEPPTGGDDNGYGLVRIMVENMSSGDTGFVWAVINDDRVGVANHPQGAAIIGFPVRFSE